jgi:hypothetical protein
MNEQDLELARSHSEYRIGGGDFCFMEEELDAFLAERDAIKHKELLAIHEVLQCIGCEHEANADDTWTVKGVKQLAERVQKAEAALQAKSEPVGTLQDLEDSDYVAKRFRLILTKLGISTPESDEELLLGAFSYLGMARRVLDDIFAAPQPLQQVDKVRELESQRDRLLEALKFVLEVFEPVKKDLIFSKRMALTKAQNAIEAMKGE